LDTATIPAGNGAGGYALFLGRMHEAKGAHRAIEIARAAGMPVKIAAKMREPSEIEYFETRVRPLLGPDAEYLGEIGGDDKYALLGDAACLLNPIAWPEPFGMVMIEALACGTPVVTTRCGAAPEIVDDGVTGFLRDRQQDLATALGEVAGLDRGACRAAVDERFSMQRMAADHAEMYASLLGTDRLQTAELASMLTAAAPASAAPAPAQAVTRPPAGEAASREGVATVASWPYRARRRKAFR
jgi:glycosyltransferase involved in cell wall biosynthesis